MPATATATAPNDGRRQCSHCGTPFTPRHAQEHFCCAGCEAVSRLIETQGLNHFYALRSGLGEPVSAKVLEPADFAPLRALALKAEMEARAQAKSPAGHTVAEATLHIDGLHCIGCRWLIAELFARQPGHGTLTIDMETHTAHLGWVCAIEAGNPLASEDEKASIELPLTDANPAKTDAPNAVAITAPRPAAAEPMLPTAKQHQSAAEKNLPTASQVPPATAANTFDLVAFAQQLQHYGYLLQDPALVAADASRKNTQPARTTVRRRLLSRLLLCGLFALNAVLLSLPGRLGVSAESFPPLRLFGMIVLLCATLCVGLAGSYFLQPDATRGKRTATRQAVAFLLFACYVAALAANGFGVAGAPGADFPAIVSFAALLAAFIMRR